MSDWSDVHWYAPDSDPGWRGEGGLPPGWDDPCVSTAGGVNTAPRSLHRLRVVRVPKDGRPLRGVILGDHVQGVWTHWLGGRCLPCRLPVESCFRCRLASISRLLGYLLIYQPMGYPVVLELPASVILRSPHITGRDAALRSWGLVARRIVDPPGGMVLVEVTEQGAWTTDTAGLPPPVDVRDQLYRLWGG